MPLTVSFQLSDRDLDQLRERFREAEKQAAGRKEGEVIASARRLLSAVRDAKAPDFVLERIEKLEQLAHMLEDAEWRLAGEDRARVLAAMAYFTDPTDLIPDQVPGLGFLDDAIVVELVCQELRHELEAYDEFCTFRAAEEKRRGPGDPLSREDWLAVKRARLHDRMRRRRERVWRARLGRPLW